MHQFSIPASSRFAIAIWLAMVCVLLVAMILLGGLTRLTDSGLSITEWKPITGMLPPLGAANWQAEFQKYQQIPEFRLQNASMDLAAFQAIYWWEWSHRFLGRIIGLAVVFPLAFFWIRGHLSPALKIRLSVLFVLGGVQGFLGWWMVYSGLGGLGDTLDVSAYRLVIHLTMAALILGVTLWTLLDVARTQYRQSISIGKASTRWAWSLLIVLVVQMALGGFVAGLDAGKIANTWPLIHGGLFSQFQGELTPFWRNWFENPVLAQSNHRMGAYLVAIIAIGFVWQLRKERNPVLRKTGWAVLGIIVLQIGLGIWTLLMVAPLSLAISHQLLAMGCFLMVLNAAHICSRVYCVN